MSNYRMDINGIIQLSDYSLIQDYIEIVDNDDNIVFHINNNPETEIDILCNLLEKDKFTILSKLKNNEGGYYVEAKKHKQIQ